MRASLRSYASLRWFSGGLRNSRRTAVSALNIPSRVTDLTVVERGGRIDITFTIPPLTTEGLALKADRRPGPVGGPLRAAPFNVNTWAAAASRVEVRPPAKPGPVHADSSVTSVHRQRCYCRREGGECQRPKFGLVESRDSYRRTAARETHRLKAVAEAEGVSLTWNAPPGKPVPRLTEGRARGRARFAWNGGPAGLCGRGRRIWKDLSILCPGVTIRPKAMSPDQLPSPRRMFFLLLFPSGLTASAGIGRSNWPGRETPSPISRNIASIRSEAGGAFVQIAAGLEAPSFTQTIILNPASTTGTASRRWTKSEMPASPQSQWKPSPHENIP